MATLGVISIQSTALALVWAIGARESGQQVATLLAANVACGAWFYRRRARQARWCPRFDGAAS